MKILKSLLCIFFSLVIVASSVPFAFSEYLDKSFVNGDSEGFADDVYYSVDSESGRVYASDNLYTYRRYYTDYSVGKLAVTNGKIYVSHGDEIRSISISFKTDSFVLSADGEISSFSYWNGRLYYLASGDVYSADIKGNDIEEILSDKNITSMWFDEDGILSYMTDEELVYSLNLETGEESSKVNVRSSFSDDISVYTTVDPDDGTTPCALTLTTLRSKFPDGKYWNHVGMSSNNEDGYTSSPCPSHNDTSTCNCFSQWSSWQCMGFAYKCAWDTTGTNAHYWNTYTNSSALDSVKVGDCIRYRNDGHTVFVIGVDGSNVTIAECNWGGNCIINWDRTISISTLKSTFTWLRTTSIIVIPGSGSVNYTLTFNANGGTCSKSSMSAVSGEKYGDLPVPSRTGYTFDGWYTAKDGGTNVTSSTVCKSNLTVYAHWTAITYTLTFDANGGQCSPSSMDVKYGEKYGTLPVPEKTGYNFDGWFTTSDCDTLFTETTCSSDATVYAHWTEKTYTVSYDSNAGGDDVLFIPDAQTKYYFSDLTLDIAVVPRRTNYKFLKWNTAADGTGTTYTTSNRKYKENADVTLYVIWEGNPCTLRFDANGGNSDETQRTVKYGEVFGTLPVPVKNDSDFQGWFTKTDGGEQVTESTIMNSTSLTIHAHWTKKQYTITYDSNGGGNVPDSQIKTYGTAVDLSSMTPSREGFEFVEYNTASDGSGTKYMPSDTYSAEQSVVLYAIWERDKYPVTYNSNGGTGTTPSAYKYYDIPLAVSYDIPEKTGCDFVEWNTSADGSGYGYPLGTEYTGNSAVTLYAIWDVAKYRITYDPNGGPSAPAQQTKIYQQSITLSSDVPSRTGFDFINWNTEKEGTGTDYNPGDTYTADAHLTLYAQWNRHKYPVYYNMNGGTGSIDSQLKYYDIKLTLSNVVPTRTGYTFKGWNTSADGTGTSYSPGGIYAEEKGTTLYAQWEANKYTITFYAMGGSCDTAGKTVVYDGTYGTLPSASKNGYNFTGWFTSSTGGTKITADKRVNITSDTVLYAGFDPIAYTVNFNANGGICSTASKSVKYKTAYGTLPEPSRTGYTFAGWFDSEECGAQITSDSIMRSIGGLTLYALWIPSEYIVTLDTAGGICDTQTLIVSYNGAYGTLPVPEKKGYTFTGWYTSQNGGSEVTSDTVCKFSENHTLYAKYTLNSYKIEFDGISSTVNAAYGSKVGTLPAYTKSGCTFCGWYTSSGDRVTEDTVYTYDEDITLKARFVDNPSSMTAVFVADGKIISQETISDDFTVTEPDVPAKAGYTGRWESYDLSGGSAVINAVYTPKTYTVTWVSSDKTVTENYKYGDVLTIPDSFGDSVISVKNSDIPETMTAGNITVNLSDVPVMYCAEFISDGKLISCVPYSSETESITEPSVPERTGYSGKWEPYTLASGGVTIFSVYTPVTYQMIFEADGKKTDSVDYTVETDEIIAPVVPPKEGYTGRWESWSYPAGGCTVNAVYTPNTYTVAFYGNGKFAGSVSYTYGADSVAEPAVPEKTGYSGQWPSYTLGASDQTVNAVYNPISYTATFVANGQIVDTVDFTVNDTSLKEPEIPLGDAVSAKWEPYIITASDMTINAVYTYTNITIKGYRSSRTEDYKTTITFTASADRPMDNAAIHWYISYNGTDFTDVTPEGKSTYTVRNATSTYYIKAVYIRNGKIIAESQTEQVNIKTDFFSRFKAFFRNIFSKLPVINQS